MIKKLKVGCPAVKGPFCDNHESYTDSELREAAEAWINVEEARAGQMTCVMHSVDYTWIAC